MPVPKEVTENVSPIPESTVPLFKNNDHADAVVKVHIPFTLLGVITLTLKKGMFSIKH